MKTALRAFIRVVRARWLWRRQGFKLHFVPLDDALTPIDARSALCGATHSVWDATTQPGGVGCWRCALAIEADVERWAPKPKQKQKWEHDSESGLTSCMTCGGVDGYPPGCRCPGGTDPEQPTVLEKPAVQP